ncbi:ShlB/FhaC/HecB family hemolysin secretion/activation protein [Kosakonia sp. H02]|nr:ShlB/FhaC/HecB family hemolysin secretion/activation protein [Kosakonia sp. H02]
MHFGKVSRKKKTYFRASEKIIVDNIKIPYEEVCYAIDELVIDNDFLNDSTLDDIKNKIAKNCFGAKGIQSVATLIQDYFINEGYVTTRIETPNQNLKSGKLWLKVVPGRIENVFIENNDVSSVVLPFAENDILNLRNIEQGLENLQKTPNVDVKINISPGNRDGYSNIIIQINRKKKWNVRTVYNNWGDESTGKHLIGGAAYLYNLAALSDVFYFSGNSSTTGGYKNISAWYSFPYGFWDYEILYSGSSSKQGIAIGNWSYDYTGENRYLSLKASRTLYRDMAKKITMSAEILRRKSAYKLADIELALQKRDMGNVRLALNYKQNFSDASVDSSISWQRFLTWFGGSKTPDMLSGDADSASHLYNANVTYLKRITFLPFQSWYEMNIGAQYTQAELTLQDQFSIGNRWSIRGFENSAGLDGNKGFYIQNTLNFLTDFEGLTAYVGTDYGQINSNGYSQEMYGQESIVGATSGLKGSIQSLGYEISLSIPLIYPKHMDVDDFTANFNFSYQL